ncbi:unnamed protein product [Caenorhabditis angaria]|uniref:Uncharacterized protein n=1 Tax=Caenorhabditis angaria TaxID=860376 RepID=A0A9P1J084_9PELO|nr:unnamed protein product [Caenorhabditis angaria]
MIAGHNLSYIGTIIGGQMTMVVWAFFFCFELPALFNCFMYRHEAAIGISNTTNSLRYPNLFVLFVAHLLPPFTAVTLQLSLLTYDQKYNLLKSKYPSCINFANDTLFEIYDWNVNPWIAISGIGILTFVLVVAAYGFGIVFHTMHILHKLRVHMSVETFKMHKNALISLSMQCLIPSIFLIVPICTVFIIIVNNMTEFQGFPFFRIPMRNVFLELSNCSFFGFTSHSCVSTIIMITTNARYSTTVKHKISQVVCQGKSSSVPVIIPLSMTNVQN